MKGLIQVPCGKIDKKETLYQAVCRETRKEMKLYTVPKYLTKDDKFNCDIYITNITREEKSQWMESEKNEPWILYKQKEWNMLVDQKEPTPSLITFKRKIRNTALPKGKMSQHEKKIHKIIIEECPTCGKIVKKGDNYYCPSQRKEVDPIILSNEPWWDTYIQELETEEKYR